MAEELVTVDWSNEEELLKEEEEEEKKEAEAAKKEEEAAGKSEEKDEAMDTSDVKDGEEKKDEAEKTLLASILRGPVKVTNVMIKDLLSKELQSVLFKSMNTQIDFPNRKGTIHLNFNPFRDRNAVDVLRRLARFQHANKEVKIQCSRAVACLLGFELRRQGVGPAPPGTLQFDKVLFLYNIPEETTEEVLRAMFDCPICIIPLNEDGKNYGCAFLEFRSKKAAKACYNTNSEIDIGEVKCTLHTRYLIGGTKETDEEVEKEEREKRKKEQDKKSMDGQKKFNRGHGGGGKFGGGGGAGKSFNKGQALKQRYNRAQQMGQFGQGRMDQGVSPNLMMNQMMAMMRMQGMGGGGGGGSGGMGGGMGRMGGQRPMSAGAMGGGGGMGYDDFGYDDYESGYGGGRNMGNMGGGRRQQMGGRGNFGSEPVDQRDTVMDLFESALDAVDNQMDRRGPNPLGRKGMTAGNVQRGGGGNKGGQMSSYQGQSGGMQRGGFGQQFDQGFGGRQNSPAGGRQVDQGYGGRQRSNSGGRQAKFASSANQRLVAMAGNYNKSDLDIVGGEDEFGGGQNVHLGGFGDREGYGGGRNQNMKRGGYDNYGQSMGGQSEYDDYVRADSGYQDDRGFRDPMLSRRVDRADMLGIDRNEPVSYPNVYNNSGGGMFGSSPQKKRRFTEGTTNQSRDTMGSGYQDDFVFKVPNLSMFRARGGKKNQGQGKGGNNPFTGSLNMPSRKTY